MGGKKCCIENCSSSSNRKEDAGVTYHKYPKDSTLREIWVAVTLQESKSVDTFVCSRHFRKTDFQIYKDSKYILKSDAIPSIFPWTKLGNMSSPEVSDPLSEGNSIQGVISLNISNESKGENLEAIKKFIEEQEKEIMELEATVKPGPSRIERQSSETIHNIIKVKEEPNEVPELPPEVIETTEVKQEDVVETEPEIPPDIKEEEVSSSTVMDIIHSDNPDAEKKILKSPKKSFSPGAGGSSMALSVGSTVEAKDFSELWYPAQIVEVDYDEMEVLVRYKNNVAKKHDEWISVSSPRLRPLGSVTDEPKVPMTSYDEAVAEIFPVREEIKKEVLERPKVTFKIGERCLARWRDNNRFLAIISEDLGDDQYKIKFDDGTDWQCNVTRLCKTQETSTVSDTATDLVPAALPYNTHLFDPTRDYLGTKSERRALKRKLNIKEIFNIGQKKKREDTPVKKKVVRKKSTAPVQVKTEVKPEVQTEQVTDAVASIIGTIKREPKEIKSETTLTQQHVSEAEIKKELLITTEKQHIVIEPNLVPEIKSVVPETKSVIPKIESVVAETKSVVPEIEQVVQEMEPVVSEMKSLVPEIKSVVPEMKSVVPETKLVVPKMRSMVPVIENLSLPVPEPVKEIPKLRNMKVVLQKMDVSKMSPSPSMEKVEEDDMEVVTIDINDGDLDSSIDDGDQKMDLEESVGEILQNQEIKTEAVTPETKNRITLKIGKDKLIMKPKKKKTSHEEKVRCKVEKVKHEIAEMKRKMEEMKKQSKIKSEQPYKLAPIEPLPESVLSPEQWCCHWINNQPVGTVSELKGVGGTGLPRRSVQVEDRRLPPGWTKHMVRRSQGTSAGKWDVVIISPDFRRFHNKTDMKNYITEAKDDSLKAYEFALLDFGAHRKLSRRLGWEVTTDEAYETPIIQIPAGSDLETMSPLIKRKALAMRKAKDLKRPKRKRLSLKKHVMPQFFDQSAMDVPAPLEDYQPPLEEGYVYVGSLKVQILENLLRCPADGCFKNFRNNTLLQLHIKHYHKELISKMGATPKVLDLASARTKAPVVQDEYRTPKVKTVKAHRYFEGVKPEPEQELQIDVMATSPVKAEVERTPRPQDSPRLRNALISSKAPKRPKVLLPVRKLEESFEPESPKEETIIQEEEGREKSPSILDFEAAISAHTVGKTIVKAKKKKTFISTPMVATDDESSDFDGRSSLPRSGSPDKMMDASSHLVSSESNDGINQYMVTDTVTGSSKRKHRSNARGEKIKIVHMKREEIINCHCGLREEDGLMIQCELCLCWQHALCHNIQREAEVPEKYTCSICLNPRRGRRSRRFQHDQDRLYEGLLPGAGPSEPLRRSHELSGNLIKIDEALHSLRVKFYVATKKDHPKLYLWAKEWDATSLQQNDYLDLNALVRDLGKENLPAAAEDMDPDRLSQGHSNLGSQALLSGLLSSPGGVSLDLPISTSELETLAKSVQESDLQSMSMGAVGAVGAVGAPQPEAAIENSACRQRLLQHVQRCQALVDARLDSIEAQVAELESQDPSFEDDETAEYFPRTKQTMLMMLRDLDAMEELAGIS